MDTIVITVAYNAEKTIKRTIESILNQSFPDFIYYIVNNGSTDRTGEIIKRFAQKDPRITVINYEQNDRWAFFLILPELLQKHTYGYMCSIDADDTYERDFLKEMLGFIKGYNLDVAACGSHFIQAATDEIVGRRQTENDLILSGEDFDTKFIDYHVFMRTIWAKIFSLSVVRDMIIEPNRDISYGGDTIFALEAFRCSQRVGILAKTLHNYYMSNKSASYIWNAKRPQSDYVLFEKTQEYLVDKVKRVSSVNEDFLYSVYFYAIRDTLNVLLNSTETLQSKLEVLGNILFKDITQKMLQGSSRFLPTKIKRELMNNVAGWIKNVLKEYPLLQGLSAGGILYWREAVVAIAEDKLAEALAILKKYAQMDIPKQYMKDYALLGSNICAQLEYVEGWVFFKKVWLDMLIDSYHLEAAEKELKEFEALFPEDDEFKAIRLRLNDKYPQNVKKI